MRKQVGWWRSLFVVVVLIGLGGISLAAEKSTSDDAQISARAAADFIHNVIEAHRTIYSTHIVDRMLEKDTVVIAEDWKQKDGLPLPAQFLLYAGRLAAEKGGVRLRLASLTPIYERNSAITEFERKGLMTVALNPDEPVTSVLRSGRRTIFKAIYADKAVSESCVICHNSHPLSEKKDFKLGEVMGGIIITFPLD